MQKNKEKIEQIIIAILIIIMSIIIFIYQTQKAGLHEDEGYTLCSSVNPSNGLMSAYDDKDTPEWRTREYVKDFMSLSVDNYLNLKSVYINQAYDNHPPIFYACVHFASILFGGQFSLYTVFIVNIIAFIFSCNILVKILKQLNKESLIYGALILYGLCMGTISMVIFQRMYMLLTLSIMLYFYLSVKLYKNNFNFDKKTKIQLGLATIFGFLTQYFFAIYAFFIFAIMIIYMVKQKTDKKVLKQYIIYHIIYAIIGILLFVPCIKHLLFSDRGLSNLGNSGYFEHLYTYLEHLAYSFTISPLIMLAILFLFILATIYLCIKSKEKFIILITIIPSIFYFLISVKMTSFQELRYIMAVIPFVTLTFFFILDEFIHTKYKNIIFAILAVALITNGIIFSKPKFLYENYKKCIELAEEHKDKSFVYVYDNFFNHMQSVEEMMIYEKTLIINYNKGELNLISNDEYLKNEVSFILSIKAYMDNETILDEIKNNSDFKNITKLYEFGNTSDVVNNNYYLVSK